MADIKNRERAQKMRKKGKSINYIAAVLDKPKSTISYWCRDIKLTDEQLKNLAIKSKHAGRDIFKKNAKIRREEHLKLLKKHNDLGIKNVNKFSKRDLDMVCIGLYWGEGYKSGNGEFGFTNSDPDMIKVYLHWLYKVHKVNKDNIILRVSINELHKDREATVLKFWQGVTKLPIKQFSKTSFIKSNSKKVYTNHETHYGTLRVKVSGGSNIRAEVMGNIFGIINKIKT